MNNKEKVLKATLELIIEHGFSGTSMNNIVEASGVSTGGVYYHFKTKHEIIHQLYMKIKKDLIQYISESVDLNEPTRLFIEKYWYSRVNWSFDHSKEKKFLDMLYESPYQHVRVCDELAAKHNQYINRVNKAIEAKEIITLDCTFFFADIDASVNVILNYLSKKPDANVEELLTFAFRKYWRSIVNIG